MTSKYPLPGSMIPIGRYYALTKSLNKNKLSILTKGAKPIYKQELISDELKHVIKQILKSNFDISDDVDLLDDRDQRIFRDVLNICNIENIFELNYDQTKNKLISKFNVMKDEILIGNVSRELCDEFLTLIGELTHRKLLTLKEYNKLNTIVNNCLEGIN